MTTLESRDLSSTAWSVPMEWLGAAHLGFAHHMNNLMTTVLGYLDLGMAGDELDLAALRQARRALLRAASSLRASQQLLAAGAAPRTLRLEELLEDLAPMLRAAVRVNLLPENHVGPGVEVQADPVQLQRSILFLIARLYAGQSADLVELTVQRRGGPSDCVFGFELCPLPDESLLSNPHGGPAMARALRALSGQLPDGSLEAGFGALGGKLRIEDRHRASVQFGGSADRPNDPERVRRRILIADGDQRAFAVLREQAARLSVDLELVGDRRGCVTALDQRGTPWDLFVCDEVLPDANSFEMLRLARSLHPQLVILRSGITQPDALPDRDARTPEDMWIVKPYGLAELLQLCEHIQQERISQQAKPARRTRESH